MMNATFEKTEKQKKVLKLLGSIAKHILLFGGSRSGKTFILIYAMVARALKAPDSRHVIIRRRFKDVRQSIGMDTLPKVMKLCFPGISYQHNKSDWYFSLPNGSEIWLCGLDDKDRADKILGREYATMYFNESSELSYDSVETALTRLALKCHQIYNGVAHGLLVNRAFYDCNPPSKSHWSYRQFIQKLNPKENTALEFPDLYASEQINPLDNAANLPPGYIEEFLSGLSERQRQRFLEGKWLDDLEGALWKRSMIDSYRIVQAPPLSRVVIGVDPAVTANEGSDLTGIVAAGMDNKGHYYVLSDKSLKASPLEWAKAVCAEYQRWKADRVIGEVNNGGDLIEMNLRNLNRSISFKSVHASRGKIIRAEPIAALYEQGKVHHVGSFPLLEEEMCGFNPLMSEKSPDRMDALVWALTELSGHAGGSRLITV